MPYKNDLACRCTVHINYISQKCLDQQNIRSGYAPGKFGSVSHASMFRMLTINMMDG